MKTNQIFTKKVDCKKTKITTSSKKIIYKKNKNLV